MNGELTLESLNEELQELKNAFNNRNVFQDITNQLLDLVNLDYMVIPIVGSSVNEGEEFKLEVSFSLKSMPLAPSLALFNLDTLCKTAAFSLAYEINCTPMTDSTGRAIVEVATEYAGMRESLDYHMNLIDKGDLDGNGYNNFELKLNDFEFNGAQFTTQYLPLIISFHLKAANMIQRNSPLARISYFNTGEILNLLDLKKEISIDNGEILPG